MATCRQAADILELRLVLLGVNPLIWRRLLERADASVADLHYTLQIVMGWEDVHLHRFHIRGRDYGLSRAGGSYFADNGEHQKAGGACVGRLAHSHMGPASPSLPGSAERALSSTSEIRTPGFLMLSTVPSTPIAWSDSGWAGRA